MGCDEEEQGRKERNVDKEREKEKNGREGGMEKIYRIIRKSREGKKEMCRWREEEVDKRREGEMKEIYRQCAFVCVGGCVRACVRAKIS